jgi:transposase
MFWGCFSFLGLGPLVALSGSQNQYSYLETLKDNLIHEMQFIKEEYGLDMTFMHDNAPCHKADSITKFFEDQEIDTVNWPAQSPDMNPIENLWAIIKQKRAAKYPLPSSEEELIEQIFSIWNNLDIGLCKNLAKSIENRLKSVIKRKGKAIKY